MKHRIAHLGHIGMEAMTMPTARLLLDKTSPAPIVVTDDKTQITDLESLIEHRKESFLLEEPIVYHMREKISDGPEPKPFICKGRHRYRDNGEGKWVCQCSKSL